MIEQYLNLGVWLVFGTLVAYAAEGIANNCIEERGYSIQSDLMANKSFFLQAIIAWPIFLVLMVIDLLAPAKKEVECECCKHD